MKHAILVRLAMGLGLLMASILTTPVRAISTTSTDFLQEIPFQVSAYGWRLKDPAKAYDVTSNPRVLSYVQLYNDSDELLPVNDWKLVIQDTTSGMPVESGITLATTTQGRVAPHSHVVAAYFGAVTSATYTISEEVRIPNLSTASTSKVKLLIRSANPDLPYRDAEYSLKLDTATAAATHWQRSFSSTGEGYTASFTALSLAPEELFDDGLYDAPDSFPGEIVEIYPYNSECAPNDTSVFCGDYIKIQLDSPHADVSDFVLRTSSNSSSRTTSNTFYLNNLSYALSDDGLLTVSSDEDGKRISLTNSGGYIWVEDTYGLKTYDETMTKYDSAGDDEQGFSWAQNDSGLWQWSTTPQPFGANVITTPVEEAVVCPAGKYLNPDTGRCRTLEEAVNALAACPEGQERNPATNRCRARVTASVAALAPCGEGQERNPLTNRCRSIASAVAELIPCDEGYERNPATNRCKKVAGVSTTSGANQYVEEATGPTWNVWTWALIGVGASGAIGYGIYEWRDELGRFGRSITAKLGKK